MSSCSTGFCGTNGGLGPLPSDPDNNLILTAKPAFGGIDVSWTYPEINPQSIAYTVIYRSTSNDPVTKVMHHRTSSDFFYDRVNPEQAIEYFYWIQWVSINGTEGELIGPTSAMARPTIQQTLEMLSGKVNTSSLAQSLKEDLQRIDMVRTELSQEIQDRLAQYEGVLDTLNSYQADVTGVATLLVDEVARLEDADTAQVSQINMLAVKSDDTEAMLLDEQRVRAEADQALGEDVRVLSASMGRQSRIFFRDIEPVAENPGDRWVDTANANTPYFWSGSDWVADPELMGIIITRATEAPEAPSEGDLWFDYDDWSQAYRWEAGAWEPVYFYDGNLLSASVQNHNTTRIGYCMINGAPSNTIDSKAVCEANEGNWLELKELADAVKGVQITDGDDETASVEQRMRSYKDDLGQLKAEYTAKVMVDSATGDQIIGGFGLAADSGTGLVDAGFDVDRFWVGKLNRQLKPFIIDTSTNEVFMDEAVIRHLTFTKLRDEAGNFMVADGRLKAQYIEASDLISKSTVTVGPTTGKTFEFNTDGSHRLIAKRTDETGNGGVVYDPDGISVYDSAGILRVKVGKL